MDIEGVYEQEQKDEEERRLVEEKRRRDAMPSKIKPFEGNEYAPTFGPKMLNYCDKPNTFIFKSKKTREQVVNEFKSKVEMQADEFDGAFVKSVKSLVDSDVECVYLPVLYVKIKKTRKSGEYSDTVQNGAPVYFSLLEGTKGSKKHFLHEFLPKVKRPKTMKNAFGDSEFGRRFGEEMKKRQQKNDEAAGELTLDEQTEKPIKYVFERERYYDVNARASKDDLEAIEDVMHRRMLQLPYVHDYENLKDGEQVTEYETLQTLLFPVWVVRVPFQGKRFHYYVSDIATEISCYNMPYSKKAVEQTEERLCIQHAKGAPLRGLMIPLFIAILLFGLVAAVYHMMAMDETPNEGGIIYCSITMIAYPVLLIVHIANFAASQRFPFAKEIPHAQMEQTRRELDIYEAKSVKKDAMWHLLILAIVLALVVIDFSICLSLLNG